MLLGRPHPTTPSRQAPVAEGDVAEDRVVAAVREGTEVAGSQVVTVAQVALGSPEAGNAVSTERASREGAVLSPEAATSPHESLRRRLAVDVDRRGTSCFA